MYEYRAKVLRVIDGDSAEFSVDLGLNVHRVETLRFAGIDTPELNSSDPAVRERAKAAKAYVSRVLIGEPDIAVCQQIAVLTQQGNLVAIIPLLPKVVVPVAVEIRLRTFKPYTTDKYGRFLASVLYRCQNDPPDFWRNLCEELVVQGHAVAYDGGAR